MGLYTYEIRFKLISRLIFIQANKYHKIGKALPYNITALSGFKLETIDKLLLLVHSKSIQMIKSIISRMEEVVEILEISVHHLHSEAV